MIAALALAATGLTSQVDAIAARAHLAGVVLIAKGDNILLEKGYVTVAPTGGRRHDPKSVWRLASISKQISAVRAMRMVERGALSLDQPLSKQFGTALAGITPRMLLQHHSGLVNPDDTPAPAGQMPAFYRAPKADISYCLSRPGTPNAAFAYNNCDYLLLGKLISGSAAVGTFGQGGATVPGFVGGKPEPVFNLRTFGAGGALTGTARDVYRFDRQLMTGKLLGTAALAELWKPEGNGSYQALGQWVFPGKLKGCAAPKRIVQRDGEIQGVQTRNFILPDDDLVVIVFTNRSSDDFKIGEVWQQSGFAFDLLSAAACG